MMSLSPFMTPDQSQRRRLAAQRRRRTRRRIMAIGTLALAIAAALVVVAMGHGHDAHGSSSASSSASIHGSHRPAHTSTAALAGGARSPSGLPLGKPVFALHGIRTGRPKKARCTPASATRRAPACCSTSRPARCCGQRNPYVRVPIASLTKMMTALLTVQSSPPDAPVLITREAVDMPGSKVGVLPLHRHVPLESLLYGLLLPSGNDAAVALAQHVAGSVNRFVVRMNAEAARLGSAARATPRRPATTTLTTSPVSPIWRCSRTWTSNSPGSPASCAPTQPSCHSRSRAASSTCTTTIPC